MALRINRNRVRQIRAEKGYSGIDMQVLTGIPYPRIYYIERGTYSPNKTQKADIAGALGCEVEDAFPAELERNPEIVTE